MKEAVCEICPHRCRIAEGKTGFCGARRNQNGTIVCESYGQLTSIALDPIEKKPLRRFCPGSKVLSVGSYGCSFRCPFCQNCSISMASSDTADTVEVTPELLVGRALELVPCGNIGLAYTYNEPTVSYEFVLDCAKLCQENGLNNILVTNGYINEEPLLRLLPYLDAANIDLKGFTQAFYRELCGDLEEVKRTIRLAAKQCHVEVTTLVIPEKNDSTEEMRTLSRWLASIDPEIPLHITRFFPMFHMTDRPPTPPDTIFRLAAVARESLHYVYEGNL
ncbi:AmmeMemoRadiSam system radical SAM enzyme [Caproiciproducens sp. LBM24188]